jgi:F0F1-type ATP synthase membrane subunit c/vacuolar-type H+-ATPase subunit K
MNQNLNVEKQYQTLAVIWFALLVSQLMFLVLLFFVKREIYSFDFSRPPLSENAPVIIAFAVLGISAVLISFVLRKIFLARAINGQKPAMAQTALVVGCALCEATTLFGLVLAFAFNYQYFFLWFALGIVGIILHFPRRENLIAASYKR